MVSFSLLGARLAQVLAANSTTILTGVGIIGVGGTAYFTAKGSFKAAEKLTDAETEQVLKNIETLKKHKSNWTPEEVAQVADEAKFTFKDKAKMVWPEFIPAVLIGGATVAAIFMSHRISTKQLAAMAAAYSLSEKNLQEYKEKIQEKLGITKAEKINAEVAQDKINENPPPNSFYIMEGADVLAQDTISGRYFRTTMEKVRRAEAKINTEILNFNEASVSSFYDAVGLEPTNISDHIGWNVGNLCEVDIDTVMWQDKPVMVINFRNRPVADYGKNY